MWDAAPTPWGEVETQGGSVQVNLRLPGQYHDPETGLHYNWHRDYDPATGRYMQSDPIGLAGGINRFAYVDGNPLSNVDIDGLQALPPSTIFARPPVVPRFKVPRPGISNKEGAKGPPSWCEGMRPRIGESGKDFARRLMDEKYGPGNYEKGPGSEFSKIQKWGDRGVENPKSVAPGYTDDDGA